MLQNLTLTISIASLILSAACSAPESGAGSTPPNIVFLLVDDMGYADTGAYGNAYHLTPHIDALAAAGMRFTHAYAAAPNCSPTRGSIVTGRWPARNGITQYLPGNVLPHAKLLQAELPLGLPLSETVIAEPLAKAGYATASIGKWHLGGGRYAPENRGFDLNYAGGHWNAHRSMFAPHPFVAVPDAREGDYLTDNLTDAAERFIETNKDRPFFLYLPYYAVHGPIQAKQERLERYAGRVDPSARNNATYAAMTEGVDESVGRLIGKLEELGLTERTVIVFFSDNGGVPRVAFNGGLRSGKGYLWEGGIREPLIVKWPGVTQPGAVEATPVSSIDFYPTILEMAGAPDAAGHTVDGTSLVPLLKQTGEWDRDTLYWHYPPLFQLRLDSRGRRPPRRLETAGVLRRQPRRVVQPRRRPGRIERSCRGAAGVDRPAAGRPGRLERVSRRKRSPAEPRLRPRTRQGTLRHPLQAGLGRERPVPAKTPTQRRLSARVGERMDRLKGCLKPVSKTLKQALQAWRSVPRNGLLGGRLFHQAVQVADRDFQQFSRLGRGERAFRQRAEA